MKGYDKGRRSLALALALLAGFIDATGFVANGKYFVSFMSGNTTRFSVDLATDRASAIVPALLIVGFLAGVTLGALLARRAGRWRKTAVIGLTTGLVLSSATGRATGAEAVFLGASALAMGAINNTFSRETHVAIGLTYMTGALVRFGQGLAAWLCGEVREGWFFNILLWVSLAFGAVGGALAETSVPAVAPWLSSGLTGLLLLFAYIIERTNPLVQPT
jgi:uncharacterized membrane protein YoaK (UPF0700 family)